MGDCYITRRGGSDSGAGKFPEFTYTGTYNLVDDGKTDDGVQNWRIKFLTSGTLTFTKIATGIDVFCVGGGGNGGNSCGAGGGGGYTKTSSFVPVKNTGYTITIGGARGNTSAFNTTAEAGKNGGSNSGKGGDGGSGGGAGRYWAYGNNGGSDGSDGIKSSDNSESLPGHGQGTTTREFGETSGTLYSGGGGGGGENNARGGDGGGGNGGKGSGGSGYAGVANTGGGGGGGGSDGGTGGSGGSGIVVIRNARSAS